MQSSDEEEGEGEEKKKKKREEKKGLKDKIKEKIGGGDKEGEKKLEEKKYEEKKHEGAVETKSFLDFLFDFLGTTTTTPSGNEGAVESKSFLDFLFDFLGTTNKEEKKPKEEEMASEDRKSVV